MQSIIMQTPSFTLTSYGNGTAYTLAHVAGDSVYLQGDGACFESTFEGKEGGEQAVREYAGLDTALHAIAAGWEALQKQCDYKLTGSTRQQGHYQHSNCTRITARIEDCRGKIAGYDPESDDYEFDTDDSHVRDNSEPGPAAARILRRFMDWVYKQLERAYDDENSDESVDGNIIANEYTFTASGKRFG